MENIKAKAWSFLIKHRIGELPINTLLLNNFDVGFRIYTYDEGEEFIKSLGLSDFAKEHDALTISLDGRIEIYYNSQLPYSFRDYYIAHEIGHIVLNHSTDGRILGKSMDPAKNNLQEKEADIFALAFLAPAPVFAEMKISIPSEISRITGLPADLAKEAAWEIIKEDATKKAGIETQLIDIFRGSINKYAPPTSPNINRTLAGKEPVIWMDTTKSKKKKGILIIGIIIMFICLAIVALKLHRQQVFSELTVPASTTSNINSENVMPETSKILVYVTPTGTKYHLPDCRYVRNNNSSRELILTDAEKEGYTPCKVCKPNQK